MGFDIRLSNERYEFSIAFPNDSQAAVLRKKTPEVWGRFFSEPIDENLNCDEVEDALTVLLGLNEELASLHKGEPKEKIATQYRNSGEAITGRGLSGTTINGENTGFMCFPNGRVRMLTKTENETLKQEDIAGLSKVIVDDGHVVFEASCIPDFLDLDAIRDSLAHLCDGACKVIRVRRIDI